jgi:hypothetical protein
MGGRWSGTLTFICRFVAVMLYDIMAITRRDERLSQRIAL